MIITELTGHIYYGSPYESSDYCGTCNGAKCEWCKERFLVGEESFHSYEEAVEYAVSIGEDVD